MSVSLCVHLVCIVICTFGLYHDVYTCSVSWCVHLVCRDVYTWSVSRCVHLACITMCTFGLYHDVYIWSVSRCAHLVCITMCTLGLYHNVYTWPVSRCVHLACITMCTLGLYHDVYIWSVSWCIHLAPACQVDNQVITQSTVQHAAVSTQYTPVYVWTPLRTGLQAAQLYSHFAHCSLEDSCCFLLGSALQILTVHCQYLVAFHEAAICLCSATTHL
jgi:hypothetical protein